jgi:hypothetical protein
LRQGVRVWRDEMKRIAVAAEECLCVCGVMK